MENNRSGLGFWELFHSGVFGWDEDEEEGLGLGLGVGGVGRGNGRGGGAGRLGVRGGRNEGPDNYVRWMAMQSRRDAIGSSRSGARNLDVNLNLGLGSGPSSSLLSSRVATGEENQDSDAQNKRLRVNSLSLDWPTMFHNEIQNHASVLEEVGGDDSSSSITAKGGAANDSDSLKMSDTYELRMDLSDDLLHMVFSFLDQTDLCRAARVCRQWRDASSHEDFWWYLNFENRSISAVQIEDLCQRYPNATALNVYGVPDINSVIMSTVFSLRNLEVLTLGKGQLEDTFFEVLTTCGKLRCLTVVDATLGNGIQEIPIEHEGLHDLMIVKCRVLRVSIRCPKLQTLSLKRTSMPHAVLNCPLLRELDIASCHKLSDAGIRLIVTSCPILESLDMSNCSGVSDETLREIARSCTNIHVLNASYCQNISLESARFPMLTVLKLHSCEGITSASMAAIAHSSMLEVLELDNCNALTSVALELPRLQSIRLVHCRKFVELFVRSSMLSSITVSNCPSLKRIGITSNALKKLVLQKQESLSMLALQCHCLQELDLTECESLTNSICEVFSVRGGCPVLTSLVLDSCERLTELSFCCASLVSLSLGGCHSITSLDLKCPNLEHLALDGCDLLERASFGPVGLKSLNLGICPKLKVLHIEAPQMVSLELKGCGVLSEAVMNCPLLRSLDASFCSQLKDNCLAAMKSSCLLIESLVLMSCRSVGPNGISSLRCLQNLTSLDLSYTFVVNLQPVYDSCLYLKVLKLQACKYLSDTSLEPLYKGSALSALCELDLSYGALSQSAIEELLACCTRLTHVSLNGCLNMRDLDWGFHFEKLSETNSCGPSASYSLENVPRQGETDHLLQNFNCIGCPNIKKVVISPTARCLHLSSLNLSLSSNLKEVDLSCSNLVVLNLSTCNSLELLKLDCPRLISLFLQSCNMNKEVILSAITQCSMLETLDIRYCRKASSLTMETLREACPSLKRALRS